MNFLSEKLIRLFRFLYIVKFRYLKIRKIIKKLLGRNRVIVSYENIKLFVGLNSYIENAILFDEYNEKNLLKLISFFSLNGYNFIDIGANIGIHSIIASKSNSNIEVYSFEPEPNNFNSFIKNLSINDTYNIKPFFLGLGNFNGIATLNINEGENKGVHSIKIKFHKHLNIPIKKLDEFKSNFSNGKLMIKIDVEGFEKEVIDGALEVITSKKDIILIIELLETINGYNICCEITENLKKNGFDTIFKFDDKGDFKPVINYKGSADYIFLKGRNSVELFYHYQNNKCL